MDGGPDMADLSSGIKRKQQYPKIKNANHSKRIDWLSAKLAFRKV